MSTSITQDMAYRQSLMKYAEKYGVSRASRKYNKSRSYIYFWRARWDGNVSSLACQSRRPHSHPNQHTEAELKLIKDMRRRNPDLGMVELWHRLRQRGYTRRPESLFRVMRKMGLFPQPEPKAAYKPKPYEQMTYPGQRVQIDVKVVPRCCIADPQLRLFQYTAIDEFTRKLSVASHAQSSVAPDAGGSEESGRNKTLSEFTYDLTADARTGKLDPVIGRDKEIKRVIQILSRRSKNNPCLIGEPGVGKTAIAEGLARKIAEGKVPEKLLSLDLTGMVAGAR